MSGFKKTNFVPHLPPRFFPSFASPISMLSFLPSSLPFPQHPITDGDFVHSDQIFYAFYVRLKEIRQGHFVTLGHIANFLKIQPSLSYVFMFGLLQLDDIHVTSCCLKTISTVPWLWQREIRLSNYSCLKIKMTSKSPRTFAQGQ